MARAGDVDHVEIVLSDHPVEVGVDEVEPRRGSPMAQQPRFDVVLDERLLQQRVVVEIDLADREVVCGAPVSVQQVAFLVRQRVGHGSASLWLPCQKLAKSRPRDGAFRAGAIRSRRSAGRDVDGARDIIALDHEGCRRGRHIGRQSSPRPGTRAPHNRNRGLTNPSHRQRRARQLTAGRLGPAGDRGRPPRPAPRCRTACRRRSAG